jgi:hypothetical protein
MELEQFEDYDLITWLEIAEKALGIAKPHLGCGPLTGITFEAPQAALMRLDFLRHFGHGSG